VLSGDYAMKVKGWGTRWEWERSKEVAVFAVDSKVEQKKLAVVKELKGVLKEFSIPLDVIDGNLNHGEDAALVQTLFDSSVKDNEINYDEFERELLKAREEGRLPYGLVVLADKDKYTFYQPPWQKERAIYGIGVPNGLVILRHTHREAVRHEFGHMLGLRTHHGGCVMDYKCNIPAFCSQCNRRIEEDWREEIDKGR
jgi:hypothetical protein